MQFLFTLYFTIKLSKIYTCYNAECKILTILHYDHLCRYFFFFFFFFTFCQRNMSKCIFFLQIFTSCVVSYPTVKKHHFRQHLIWKFHENQIPFFTFLPIQIYVLSDLSNSIRSENNTLLLSFPDAHANPRSIWVGPPGGYRESLWNALLLCRQFQQSKVHLVHQVQMDFRWPVAVFTF